ncbi:hypothetical protein OG455_23345 [Kitasatospora sp. NBC_01287]|uniref:hypothetical protein n=1 Tax=Kitasatospora sp. NBC_01287 TaxID=2903573 RepID=UPI00225A15F6|nr:hypothetical protein [Kitasatospora sp. NBC_01287]MCX4748415.1 hypothetical protein [Kitasatospora sp. NBC_01287]
MATGVRPPVAPGKGSSERTGPAAADPPGPRTHRAAASSGTAAPTARTSPARSAPTGLARLLTRAYWTTPRRVRALTAAALAAVLLFAGVAWTVLSGARASVDVIGHRAAPQAERASDLYFALGDLDAQAANLLLVGADEADYAKRSVVHDAYDQRRAQADGDLEAATEALAGDGAGRKAVQDELDALGRYEALVARSDLQESTAKALPGKPPADALASYQQATDLLRSQLLPDADQVADANAAKVAAAYGAQRSDLGSGWWWLLLTGLLALGALAALQRTLAVRYRRTISPPLVAAALLAVIGLGYGLSLASDTRDRLHTATVDAYDSVLALSRAKAVAYDSNADESRWLSDPSRADSYQQAFLDKSRQVVKLDGSTLASYDAALDTAIADHQASAAKVDFGGYLGDEERNITFPGEQQAADQVLADFRTYQQDDRTIRTLAQQGRLGDAIAFDTGTAAGQSDGDFSKLSDAFDRVVAINQQAFDSSIADSDAALGTGAVVACGLLLAGALALTLLAVRPRLREYR